jgi:hypothetical protein
MNQRSSQQAQRAVCGKPDSDGAQGGTKRRQAKRESEIIGPMYVYLFICGLFNEAVSNSDCTALNGWVISEFEGMCKEVVVA